MLFNFMLKSIVSGMTDCFLCTTINRFFYERKMFENNLEKLCNIGTNIENLLGSVLKHQFEEILFNLKLIIFHYNF